MTSASIPSNRDGFCACTGWWDQSHFGRQPMGLLQIKFSDEGLVGFGSDIVGPFELMGIIGEGAQVVIRKQYIDQHEVIYRGEFDGEGTMAGRWEINGFSGGNWSIRVISNSQEPEIQEIKARTSPLPEI